MHKSRKGVHYRKKTKAEKQLAKGRPLQLKCPYCGKSMVLRESRDIYKDGKDMGKMYVCSAHPTCDTYVRTVPGTMKPLGQPANGSLRRLRVHTHSWFDQLWKTGLMTRSEAYEWLAYTTGLPKSVAHIGCFQESMCTRVIIKSKQVLKNKTALKRTS